jgi:hypothetical protein
MNNQPRRDRLFLGGRSSSTYLMIGLLTTLACGCTGGSVVRLVSYRDPYFPEHYRVNLANCVYRTEPGGGVQAVGCTTQQTSQGLTTQYICIHIFWKPIPGKTPANSTMTDAVLRYVISTDTGVAVYTGTGFAYPKPAFGGGLDVALESGRLRLQSRSGLEDLLGNTQITGQLRARDDSAAAATLIREAELLAAR